ncbi:hybrid sensor histidine kinase/response regulator [Flavobacterium amniphilum]|uniref:ATP-binding response regulator n=1 Tax=Flavobacterium amniphilum TaxID=1834035 RepID=UPI00202AA1FE|nr:hybrid sensor histidine kinase/response regulator [Flavobacterium amniphilum]MCL9807509.1 hybrid sensor histidine kinase/response regulator [Flavobacterium amniphilum]
MEGIKMTYVELKSRITDLKQKVDELTSVLEETYLTSQRSILENPGGHPPVSHDFINAVLHKIKTPLDTVVGLAKLMSTAKLDIEERAYLAKIINNCSNELQGAFSEFMSFSSLKQNGIRITNDEVSLNEILDSLKEKFRSQVFFKGLTFKLVKGLPDEDRVMIDKNIMIEVFTSLLNNALRFTDQGFVEMGYQVIDNRISFYVKDSGVGFDPEFKEKLFGSLNRDEAIIDGETKFGLGLSTVKHYADLLGGTLKAESEPGGGSAFYFEVPYVPAARKIKSTAQKKTIKVLIAEDEEISFMLLKKLLDKGNVEIIRAKNGEEAYEIYKNNPDINLILMDIRMPQVDGYVAAQLIKHEAPEIPIIAQSSYSFKEDKDDYGNAFNGYLSKPVNRKDFESVVHKYIDMTSLN